MSVFALNFCPPEFVEGSDTLPIYRKVKEFYVYILSNTATVLYIGVTSNLEGRFWEHAERRDKGFASRYNIDRLIYFEFFPNARDAIARERQLKGWRREKKLALIATMNPSWRDLSGRLRR